MQVFKGLAGTFLLLSLGVTAAAAQERSTYSKNGISFEYLKGWEVREKPGKDSDEIGLSNVESDSQVAVIALKKPLESDDPAEARKRVVDPWLQNLQQQYQQLAGVQMARVETTTTVAGQKVDAVDFNFVMDGQQGKVQACWVLFEKHLVLLYILRPERTAEKANQGWEALRSSLKVEKKK